MNVKAVVPELPSLPLTSLIVTLHSNRRSWRWFLSPQPFPGLVTVGVVVVVVDVLVEVVVDVVMVVEYSYSTLALAPVPKAPNTKPPTKMYATTATPSAVRPGR